MKYQFEYRTSDNVCHEDVVIASTREAAFAALKQRGIRPARLHEAPGLANKVFGKGKRWIAIVILSFCTAGLLYYSYVGTAREAREDNLSERSQIYGDVGVLRRISKDDWSAVFPDKGDRFLARYAIPGVEVLAAPLIGVEFDLTGDVEVLPDDLEEVKSIKRIVNGMREELRMYLSEGGTVEGYVKRLNVRQREECRIFNKAKEELRQTHDQDVWLKRNAELRTLGLPMVNESDFAE